MRRHLLLRPVALLLAAIAPAAIATAATTTDPLGRPAEMARHPETGVLLAVTRAGGRLVAAGERGIVLLSDDNGASWRQARVPASVTLTALSFPTPETGWAVGHAGLILRSDDGGESWSRVLDGKDTAALELAAAKAAASADPAAQRRLRDATQALDAALDNPLLDVGFLTPEHGFVIGAYGAIFETRDAGRHWQSRRDALDNPRGKHLYRLYASADRLYIAGEQGALFESSDEGDHFQALATPYRGTYFGVATQADAGLIAYGLRGNALQSSDTGASWQALDLGQPITVTASASLPDRSLVLVDEAGRVLRRAAGGAVFQALKTPQSFSFTSVAVAADGGLVLAGIRGLTRIAPPILETASTP